MDVAIPHSLGKDTVRERLRSRGHLIGEGIPGGMAEVTTQWPSEDRMVLNVSALGQTINAHVDIEDSQVVFVVDGNEVLVTTMAGAQKVGKLSGAVNQ